MTQCVLALDLAKVAGFACWREGWAKPDVGIQDTSDQRQFPKVGDRLAALYRWGLRYTKEMQVTDIVCESPVIGGGKEDKIIWLVGAYAVFMMLGAQCKIHVSKIRNDTFFIHWCGTNNIEGDARKSQSVCETQRRGFPKITDHNMADALGVLSLRCSMLGLRPPWDFQKSPGPLFTGLGQKAPAGVKISRSNKRNAAILVNRITSFKAGEG